MGILRLEYSEKEYQGSTEYFIPSSTFDRFNASLLDLGDISKEGEYVEALAAVVGIDLIAK